MPRVDLQVPFSDKEQAKRLGARWDNSQRTWYVPDGMDSAPFKNWLPQPHTSNIRALTWDFVGASRVCWRCEALTRVFAIVLPPGHETLIAEDDARADRWVRGECTVLLSYVCEVPGRVAAQFHMIAPRYWVDYSRTTGSSYWMNHCEHCDAKLGDFETIEEPGTFYELWPDLDQRTLIIRDYHPIAESFSGSCGGFAVIE